MLFEIMFKLIGVCAFFVAVNCKVIPSGVFEPCSRTDATVNNCLMERFEKVKPYILTGLPELNIPVLDPFEIKEFETEQKISEAAGVKIKLTNLIATGAKDIQFNGFNLNPDTLLGEVDLLLPSLHVETEYDVTVMGFLLPIQTRGFFRGNFSNIAVSAGGKFSKVTKNNLEYLQVSKPEFIAEVGGGIIKMTSKNPEFQLAADMIANFFNSNPQQTLQMIAPVYIRAITAYAKTYINSVLASIPYNEIFLD